MSTMPSSPPAPVAPMLLGYSAANIAKHRAIPPSPPSSAVGFELSTNPSPASTTISTFCLASLHQDLNFCLDQLPEKYDGCKAILRKVIGAIENVGAILDALARKEAALEERRNMLDGASVKREELAGLWAELKDMKLFNHKVLSMLQKSVGEEHPRKRQKGRNMTDSRYGSNFSNTDEESQDTTKTTRIPSVRKPTDRPLPRNGKKRSFSEVTADTINEEDDKDEGTDYYGKPENWTTPSLDIPGSKFTAVNLIVPKLYPPSTSPTSSNASTPGFLDAVVAIKSLTTPSPRTHPSFPGMVYSQNQIPNLSPKIRNAIRSLDSRSKNWWERSWKYNIEHGVAVCAHTQIISRNTHGDSWTNGTEYACFRCVKNDRPCLLAVKLDGEIVLVVRPAKPV